jgi:hypothetical protein
MVKKKAPGKNKANKPEKEPVSGTKPLSDTKPLDVAQVREQIAGMVRANAIELVAALVESAKKDGDLARTKYFLEIAKIFPAPEGGEETNEDSLVRTLMQALGIPEEPTSGDGDGNVVSSEKGRDGV